MISAILALVGLGGLAVGGGVGYLAMKGKLASVEASLKSHIKSAVDVLEGTASKVEDEAKSDVAYVAAFLKSKL